MPGRRIYQRQEQDGGIGRAEDLRANVQTLDDEIKTAARRLLTENESLRPILREQLREMQAVRERLRQDLAALESNGPAPTEAAFEAEIDRITALVDRLAELRRLHDLSELRDLLTVMVDRIELFFEHTVSAGRKRSRVVKGLIHPRKPAATASNYANCSRKRLLWRRARLRSAREPS